MIQKVKHIVNKSCGRFFSQMEKKTRPYLLPDWVKVESKKILKTKFTAAARGLAWGS